MGQNLTGQTISSTYEDLVQISGSILTNGLGTEITSVSVTASNAISASYAVTASYALNAGATVNTGSLMVTGSVNSNTLTFTKGDGSQFSLTVATGSGGGTVDTGSLLVTASISDATTTYTKGDGSTFSLTVNNVQNAFTASTAGTAGYAFTAGTAGFATSASFASQAGTAGYAVTAGTAGFATSASFADQSGTAGYAATAGTAGFATSASFADQSGTSGFATSASFAVGALTTASVSLNTITFTKGDGTTFPITVDTGSGGGGAAFPYTGSAIITGSLIVTGSQAGLLRNLESIEIFATSSTNSVQPNILIGAQNPTVLGLNTGLGTNNVVIGTGEFLTDLKGLASGSGNSNTIVGGFGGYIARGQYNTIVGGGFSTIASGSTLSNALAAQFNFMAGGTNNTIGERTTHSNVVGGASNQILAAGTNGSVYSTILGGQTNYISGSDYAGILASRNSDITFGNNVAIVGGNNLTATYATATSAYSAMLGGNGNTLSHSRTVVIGGQNLASTKNDEVVVPALTISGSGNLTFADGTTQSTAAGEGFPYTGSAEILGNVNVTISGSSDAYLITSGSFTGSAVDNISAITGSTQVKHVAYCTQAEYNAIIPDSNTLYFISGSGNDVENLTVSGSLLVSGSTVLTGSVVGNVNALSISSNTASLDLNSGNFFTLQLVSGSNTFINPSNIKAGQTINLRVNTTGSATVSFPSSVKQVSGSAYVPTTTTGVDIVTFISFDTSSLFLSNVKNLV